MTLIVFRGSGPQIPLSHAEWGPLLSQTRSIPDSSWFLVQEICILFHTLWWGFEVNKSGVYVDQAYLWGTGVLLDVVRALSGVRLGSRG